MEENRISTSTLIEFNNIFNFQQYYDIRHQAKMALKRNAVVNRIVINVIISSISKEISMIKTRIWQAGRWQDCCERCYCLSGGTTGVSGKILHSAQLHRSTKNSPSYTETRQRLHVKVTFIDRRAQQRQLGEFQQSTMLQCWAVDFSAIITRNSTPL